MQNKKSLLKKIKLISLTVLFFYFVSMMIVMGNGHAFLGRYFSKIYLPVASTIGLNTTWNFFSPDPAHTMYMRYLMFYDDDLGNSVKEPSEGFIPESQNQGGDFRMNKRRLTYIMRWMILDSNRVQNFLVPYLCIQDPSATRVQIELKISKIPPLDTVVALQETTTYQDLLEEQGSGPQIFDCPKSEINPGSITL